MWNSTEMLTPGCHVGMYGQTDGHTTDGRTDEQTQSSSMKTIIPSHYPAAGYKKWEIPMINFQADKIPTLPSICILYPEPTMVRMSLIIMVTYHKFRNSNWSDTDNGLPYRCLKNFAVFYKKKKKKKRKNARMKHVGRDGILKV